MGESNQKLKLLYLAKIFEEQTDENHGLSMPQLVEALDAYGIHAERKTLYNDIKLLEQFGYSLEKLPTSPVSYALVNRTFSQGELLLLADAVQSSKFLTQRKSESLIKSIKTLGSRDQAKDLAKHLHVEGRIKMQNESVFYTLDAIQRAIAAKRKVQFHYFKYNEEKERVLQHNGDLYVETPVQMTYSDGCYYLIVFNDKHDSFATYRIDRMLDVDVSEERATRNEKIACFDVADYQARVFDMFSGDPVTVTLSVKAEAMGAVIDRFGKDVMSVKTASETATVTAPIMESPTFFGWLAALGNLVSIQKPASLKRAYKDYLQAIIDSYQSDEG